MIIAVVEQITDFIYLYINFKGNKNYNVLILIFCLTNEVTKWSKPSVKSLINKVSTLTEPQNKLYCSYEYS